MKKRFLVFLIVAVMALSFAVPAMATVAVITEPVAFGEENIIHTEMTQIYHRMHNGRLQFRVWSITYGRWLTDWTYV